MPIGFGDPVAISAETGEGMQELYVRLRDIFKEKEMLVEEIPIAEQPPNSQLDFKETTKGGLSPTSDDFDCSEITLRTQKVGFRPSS